MFLFKFYDLPSENGLSFAKYVDLYFADFYMENSDSCIPIFGISISFPHLHFSGLAHTKASQPRICSMEPWAAVSFHADSRKGFPNCTHKWNNWWTGLIPLIALLFVHPCFKLAYFPPLPSSRLKYLILLFPKRLLSPLSAEISLLMWVTKMLSSTGQGNSGCIGWRTHTETGNRTSTDFIGRSIKSWGQL